ncbi:unnamed protein product [Rotaria sordida]|uniref:F-box domain-containing protein n=1 Tax=Rotaria sordida TaxID=392033 RepID=A0A819V4C3_9BILA|nr:unnamed protein product [Rotaria sordida]CAF4104086.1 unnamed protein product [Rotaria sordida]
MNLEQLPNELLLELFEYMNSVHLLRAFSHLNFRFDNLLLVHFQTHGLDFRSISKDDFDIICRLNLPTMIEQIIALRLSYDDDTPHQIDLFFFQGFTLNRFIHLQILSIYHIYSNELLKKIVGQCRHLLHLHRLDFIKCTFKYHRKTLHNVLNSIWHLLKLKSCHLDWHILYNDRFPIARYRSKSIEYLSTKHIKLNITELIRLFRSTTNLRYLDIYVYYSSNNKLFLSPIFSLVSLKLHIFQSDTILRNLIKNLPNLIYLTIISEHINFDGYQWEEIIVSYLSQLKQFRFQMYYNIDHSNDEHFDIDRILLSYQTPFWLIERKTFVRIQWNTKDQHTSLFVYTLPYYFDFFAIYCRNSSTRMKSTCSSETDYQSYDRVIKLNYYYSPLNNSFLSNILFHNIQHLNLTLPFGDQFFSILPYFDRIISLTVSDDSESDSTIVFHQLQTLLDRMINLYSLTIGGWHSSMVQEIPFYIRNKSIRQLDLQHSHYPSRDRCFNQQQCIAFLRSTFAGQCQALSIVLDHRKYIFDLIEHMPNLHALKVECELDQSNNDEPNTNELGQWMVSNFSPFFVEDVSRNEMIRLWIR